MDLDEVMTDEGYTEEADRQTGMMNQQPNEDVVVNISVEVTNENGSVSDMGWQHSMIRKWVATQFLWCSKNGSGDVYQFSDNHYNDHLLDIGIGGPGKTLSERTYRR